MNSLEILGSAIVCISLISASHASSDWTEVKSKDREDLVSLIDSALETHWSNTTKGWCLAMIDRQSLDGRILQVEYSWKGLEFGMVLRDATDNFRNRTPVSEPHQICVYGPKESWVYFCDPKVNSIEGYGGKNLRTPGTYLDCRPHSVWLSTYEGQHPEFSIPNLFSSREGAQLFLSPDKSKVQFRRLGMTLEFDANANYAPILFENHMDVTGVVKGKTPRREKYEVAQDELGVWYCKKSESWVWRKGLDSDPNHHVNMEVIEYLSAPSPLKMKLNYATIGANTKTKVVSRIPGRSGTWRYGRGEVDKNAEEDELRKIAEKLRSRGFGTTGDN